MFAKWTSPKSHLCTSQLSVSPTWHWQFLPECHLLSAIPLLINLQGSLLLIPVRSEWGLSFQVVLRLASPYLTNLAPSASNPSTFRRLRMITLSLSESFLFGFQSMGSGSPQFRSVWDCPLLFPVRGVSRYHGGSLSSPGPLSSGQCNKLNQSAAVRQKLYNKSWPSYEYSPFIDCHWWVSWWISLLHLKILTSW